MRIALSLIALTLTTGAAAELPVAPQAVPPEPVPGALTVKAEPKVACRDRVELVRQERGLPMLQRDTATPNEPLMLYAVDHRIDGCSVMVMAGNSLDVRPLPEPAGPGKVIPAR